MKKLATTIFVAAAIGAVSCKKDTIGHGPVTTQTRSVQNFTGIDLQMNGSVYYTSSSTVKIEVSAPESIHGMLETNVIDNRLVIRYANGKTYDSDDNIRINVSAPNLESLQLTSSGSIHCMSDIHPANLYLRTTGSGDIFLKDVMTSNLEASSTRSGMIIATGGVAMNEKLKTDGSGKIDLSAITATNVTARTVGSGDIRVKVSGLLDVTIDGSGSVYFTGYPALSSHISGSGHIIRL